MGAAGLVETSQQVTMSLRARSPYAGFRGAGGNRGHPARCQCTPSGMPVRAERPTGTLRSCSSSRLHKVPTDRSRTRRTGSWSTAFDTRCRRPCSSRSRTARCCRPRRPSTRSSGTCPDSSVRCRWGTPRSARSRPGTRSPRLGSSSGPQIRMCLSRPPSWHRARRLSSPRRPGRDQARERGTQGAKDRVCGWPCESSVDST